VSITGVKYISQSIKGINKNENQDNFFIEENLNYYFFVVFDGVGSAANGKLATQLVCDYLKHQINKHVDVSSINLRELMFGCHLYLLSLELPEAFTTYCSLFVPTDENERIVYSSMGDSRIYVITNQYIEQISQDDKISGDRNVITKCLGLDSVSIRDFKQQSIPRMDGHILLCTDGFYHLLEDNKAEFFESINKKSLTTIESDLDKLTRNKNIDDSTYILIR